MRIKKIIIKNFKGIENLTIDLNYRNVSIYGDNKAGKTTVADAITWCLFGKNSNGSSNFAIKPLNIDNTIMPNTTPSVEIIADIISIKRIHTEEFRKKSGTTKKIFTGYKTKYYINDVPVKQKDFQVKINEICDETKFKLLTNPKYFNEEMHWLDRRKLLIDICGDIDEQKIISKNNDFEIISDIINNGTIEEKQSQIKENFKNINNDLNKIPVQIMELKKIIQNVSHKRSDIENSIQKLQHKKALTDEKILSCMSGNKQSVLKNDLLTIQNQINVIQNNIQKQNMNIEKELSDKLQKRDFLINSISEKIKNNQNNINEINSKIQQIEQEIEILRNNWKFEEQLEFVETIVNDVCPNCGNQISKKKISEIQENAKHEFNLKKSEKLEDIKSRGIELSKKITALNHEKNDCENHIKKHDFDIENIKIDIQRIKNKYKQIDPPQEYNDLLESQKEIELKLNTNSENDSVLDELNQEKEEISWNIDSLNRTLLVIENNERIKQLIFELEKKENDLVAKCETLEKEMHIINEYNKIKISTLTEKINSMFETAKFQMFEAQINSSIKECCNTLVDGVPYNSINNATKINVGLEICQIISQHIGVCLPIIIDNAESITNIYQTNSQQIKLYVCPGQKTLKIEKN